MDNTQIETIVVTAVVSVVAKELVTWLLSLFKELSVGATIKEKIKAIFSKANRKIMGDFFPLIFYIFILINYVSSPSPPTRLSVLIIIGLILAIVILTISLLWHIAQALANRESPKKDPL